MTTKRLATIAADARIAQFPAYIMRAVGLPFLKRADFLPALSAAERDRLASFGSATAGNRPPAIFIHGVLPRSGTNLVSDALSLHPQVAQNPGDLWEFPLLSVAASAAALERDYLARAPGGAELKERFEFLALLATAWMDRLQQQVAGRTMMFKSPHMQNIGLFQAIFPRDYLILCIRDGRDIAESSARTFGKGLGRKTLIQIADEWSHATEGALTFEKDGANANPRAIVVRFEELVRDPAGVVRRLLTHCGLATDSFDFEALLKLRVRGSSSFTGAPEKRWQPVEKDAAFDPVGRWQAWSPAKRALFQWRAGKTLERAGYSLG
jgi:protein-tyrosine sulfotransferase